MMSEEKKVENELKTGFFKKVWQSITKIEKYPDMAAEGVGKAISYMAKIVAILAIVLCLGMLYQTYQMVGKAVEYLQNECPEFSYQDGILKVETESPITIEENSVVGKAIIDTETQDENKINEYINSLQESGDGIIVLRDKVILKNGQVSGTIYYEYKEMFEQMGITQFTKQDVINYANSSQMISLYVSIFLTIFIYSFIMYLLTTLSNAIMLSVLGYLTTWIAKIKMRYVAIFNMSVYALTLSTILNMIYIAINIFIEFNMEYFQVMYVTVAAIYLIAAIFILKTEFMKKQMELMKIAEAQEIVKKELDKKEEKEEEEKKENKETGKDEQKEGKDVDEKGNKSKKKKEEGEETNLGQEPEGSNA